MIPANFNLWHFSIRLSPFFRPLLSLSALVSASGVSSTSSKVTATTTPARMLMYGKEASNRKQEIDRQHYTSPNQRPKDKHVEKISTFGFSYNAEYGGIPPTPYIFLSVYIEFVFSKMQTTPRIGFWLDNSSQTPQQTAENILNARKPV